MQAGACGGPPRPSGGPLQGVGGMDTAIAATVDSWSGSPPSTPRASGRIAVGAGPASGPGSAPR